MKKFLSLFLLIAIVLGGLINLTSCEQSEPPETIRLGDSLMFGGYTWEIKASEIPTDPGPNPFSGRSQDIWIDNSGKLHMKLAQHNGVWYSTEFTSRKFFGYGKYSFTIIGDLKNIPPNAVIRFFTYDPETYITDMYSQINYDLAYGGYDTLTSPFNFYVEPKQTVSPNGTVSVWNERQFRPDSANGDLLVGKTTHVINWKQNEIIWECFEGDEENRGETIASWIFDDTKPGRIGIDPNVPNSNSNLIKVPAPGLQTRLTFSFHVNPVGSTGYPSDRMEREIIIENFEYVPAN